MLYNIHINDVGRLTLDWIDSTLNPFLFLINIEYLDANILSFIIYVQNQNSPKDR